ncbi:MAG: hypothetical protein A2Y62_01660 [Candidatus Fischerbacteria bacterium RBG_13_37_8]|uniref:Uncharacterized protein n=1 Tax=Candidatus Fischerbacteria bacterium RBG_13_37_8 TaxID=1817863 RepID=A0A1F5VE51_9BACT|nr:MAG: hypothetical protein A2Y62_01660 [Candidatus Fischerbacteria bacterium RBG_13_37_8]
MPYNIIIIKYDKLFLFEVHKIGIMSIQRLIIMIKKLTEKTVSLLLMLLFCAYLQGAQEKKIHQRETLHDIIRSSLELYTYKIGFIRLIPEVKWGFQYDSNVLSNNIEQIGDVVAQLGPAIEEKFAIRNIALFRGYQYISYVYYRDLENLRNYPHTLDFSITTGRKTLIIQGTIGNNKGIIRPSSETDIPADQRLRYYDASVKIPAPMNMDITLFFNKHNYFFTDYYSFYGQSINEALSRDETRYILEIQKPVTAKTNLFFHVSRELYQFDYNPFNRNYQGNQGYFGFVFDPKAHFTGYMKFGYKNLKPENETLQTFKGFIVSAAIEYRPVEYLKLKIDALRQPMFSIYYEKNNYYVQNQFSFDIIWAFRDNQAIGAGYLIGNNTYPNPVFVELAEKLKDDYNEIRMSYTYKFRKDFYIESSVSYFRRDSNFQYFIRERLLFGITFKYSL